MQRGHMLERQGRDGFYTCRGGIGNIHWTQDVEDGCVRQEEEKKSIDKIHGCGEERDGETGVREEDARDW